MNTTRQTLTTIMSLVDNHKDDLSEGEYLTVCNVMRDLHRATTQPEPPQPEPTQPIQFRESVFPVGSQGWFLEGRLMYLNRELMKFDRTQPRIKVVDKLDVFKQFYHDTYTSICGNPRYYCHCDSSKALLIETQLIDNGIRERLLKQLYRERRDQRRTAEREAIVEAAATLAVELANLNP